MKAPEIVTGSDGQIAAAVAPGADTVVTGVVGVAGLLPTIEAIKLGRTIALANKETLISGGPVILPLLKKHGAVMTPRRLGALGHLPVPAGRAARLAAPRHPHRVGRRLP